MIAIETETPLLYSAFRRMLAVLDTRVLPDPLQDEVYLFSLEVQVELRSRPDHEEVQSRFVA